MERVLKASRKGRNGKRDYAICLLLWRHGMRASELCELRMGDLDLKSPAGAKISFERKKGSDDAENHPLHTPTYRAIKAWLRIRPNETDYVFVSEQGGPLHRMSLYYLVKTWGERALIPFPIHPHMFRHSCGFHLGNNGTPTHVIQQYLGHRDIRNTAMYTAKNPDRFRGIWGH